MTPPADAAAEPLKGSAARRGLRLSPSGRAAELAYLALTALAAVVALVIIGYLLVKTFGRSLDAFSTYGVWGFITGTEWIPSPVSGAPVFGALPFIYGTLVTSALAMVIAVPIAIGVALATTVFLPKRLRGPIGAVVDLLAAVPSVIYGLWGVIVLVPAAKPALQWIADHSGGLGFLAGPVTSGSYLISGLVLGVMVLPIIAAITREVLLTVPVEQQEAALGLGATRWEMVRSAMLPWARSGIVGASALGLGRAVGETIAIALLLGNSPHVGGSLLGPGATLASGIALEAGEASGLHLSALTALAVVLFIIAFIINALARLLVTRSATGPGLFTRAFRLVRPRHEEGERPATDDDDIAHPRTEMLELPRSLDRLPTVSRARRVRSGIAEGFVYLATVLAIVPLGFILGYIIVKGAPAISWTFFTTVPNADPFSHDTGISSALVGTLILIGLAALFAVPLGILVAFFMFEARASRSNTLRRISSALGFIVDVLLGVPSIVVGVTVFLGIVVVQQHFSAFAGGVALAVLMFPIVVRTADEILRLVPNQMKEAALGLGAPRWRVAWSVILPAAASGLLTGVMLAVARVAGETAPLLFTASSNQFFSTSLSAPIASLPKLIYDDTVQIQTPVTLETAWGAALVLVVIILLFNLIARLIARKTRTLEAR